MSDLNDILARIRSSYTAEDPKGAKPAKTGKVSTGKRKIVAAVSAPVKREPTAEDARIFLESLRVVGKRQAVNDDGSPAFYTNGAPKMVTDHSKVRDDEAKAINLFSGDYLPADHGGSLLRAKTSAMALIRISKGDVVQEVAKVDRAWSMPKGVPDREQLAHQIRDAEIRNAIDLDSQGKMQEADLHLALALAVSDRVSR